VGAKQHDSDDFFQETVYVYRLFGHENRELNNQMQVFCYNLVEKVVVVVKVEGVRYLFDEFKITPIDRGDRSFSPWVEAR